MGRWPKKSRRQRGGSEAAFYAQSTSPLQNILPTLIGVLGYAYMARVITQAEIGVTASVTVL